MPGLAQYRGWRRRAVIRTARNERWSSELNKTLCPFIFPWKRCQMFLGLYNNSGWRGAQEVSSPTPDQVKSKVKPGCSGSTQLGLKSFKDGDFTPSLGTLLHCSYSPHDEKFLLMSNMNHCCFNLCFMAVKILYYAFQSKK